MSSILYCNSYHSTITTTLFEEISLSQEPTEIIKRIISIYVCLQLTKSMYLYIHYVIFNVGCVSRERYRLCVVSLDL